MARQSFLLLVAVVMVTMACFCSQLTTAAKSELVPGPFSSSNKNNNSSPLVHNFGRVWGVSAQDGPMGGWCSFCPTDTVDLDEDVPMVMNLKRCVIPGLSFSADVDFSLTLLEDGGPFYNGLFLIQANLTFYDSTGDYWQNCFYNSTVPGWGAEDARFTSFFLPNSATMAINVDVAVGPKNWCNELPCYNPLHSNRLFNELFPSMCGA